MFLPIDGLLPVPPGEPGKGETGDEDSEPLVLLTEAPPEDPSGTRADLYEEFWTAFLKRLHEEHPDWPTRAKPRRDTWFSMSSGLSGTTVSTTFGPRLRAEITVGRGDAETNTSLFEDLLARKEEIEKRFGDELSWESLPPLSGCRIATYYPGPGRIEERDLWDEYMEWFLESLARLKNALPERSRPT